MHAHEHLWRENTYIRVKKWHKYEIFMILIRLKGYCCLNDLLYQIVLHQRLKVEERTFGICFKPEIFIIFWLSLYKLV